MGYTAEAVNQELVDREMCRRWLLPYTQRFTPDYQVGWFHRKICEKIEKFEADIVAGVSPRLIICAPPRHGKSAIVSRCAPTWMLGRHPDWELIVSTYGQDLADDLGRWAKNTLIDPRWCALFPGSRVRLDSRAANRLDSDAGGGIRYVGVGGPLTGRGGRCIIIDDPVKNREEADSERYREMTWSWYTSVLRTRLAPGGGIIVMATRWHEDDLIGRLIQNAEIGEKFDIVSYPAIAEEDEEHRVVGDPLHEARYPIRELHALRKTLPPRDWLSLYQQRPAAPEGTYFKVSLVNVSPVSRMPKLDTCYQAWDLAVTPEAMGRGDYSVGACIGKDDLGRYWLMDMVRGRWSSDMLARHQLAFWRKHTAKMVWMESGPILSAYMPLLQATMKQTGIWMPVDPISHGGKSKEVRAISLRGLVNNGNLNIPDNLKEWPIFREEMAAFPAGKHDDTVDAVAYLALKMATMRENLHTVAPRIFTPTELRSREARESFRNIKQRSEAEKEVSGAGWTW